MVMSALRQVQKGVDVNNVANDIEKATSLARSMVTKWGFSEKMGPLTYTAEEGEVFLGRSVTSHKEISDVTAADIDREIRALIDRNYKRAEMILAKNKTKLENMAQALIKYETIGKEQIDAIMNGLVPNAPDGWQECKKEAIDDINKAAMFGDSQNEEASKMKTIKPRAKRTKKIK